MKKRTKRKITKAIVYMLTGAAFGFLFMTYRGLQGDHYIRAVVAATAAYGWLVLLYWANFIKPMLDGEEEDHE